MLPDTVALVTSKELLSALQNGQLERYGKIRRDDHEHLHLGEIEFGRMMKDVLTERLEKLGLSMHEPAAAEARGPLAGQTYVITGTLPSLSRARAAEVIEAAGGHVTDSVSKNTTALVAGADAGSKLDRAKALGVPVIDEAELLRRARATP